MLNVFSLFIVNDHCGSTNNVEKASHRQRVHPLEFLVHLVQGVEVVGLAEVLALQLEAGLVEDPDAVEVAATTSSEELGRKSMDALGGRSQVQFQPTLSTRTCSQNFF